MNRSLSSGTKALLLVLVASLVIVVATSAPRAQMATPSQTINRINAVLLQVMKQADELGFQGRRERLAPELSRLFDFQTMAKASVGRTWRKLDAAQQTALVKAFAAFSIATYAKRFDGYGGERFEVLGEEPGKRDMVLVRSRIIKADGEAVSIDYLTRNSGTGWQIIDILLDARISELASKRSEYTTIIKRRGFDHLLQSLQDKTVELGS